MSTPVSLAACSAPALTTSQNESPSFACVMTSTRKADPAPLPALVLVPPSPVSSPLPLLSLLHPARTSAPTARPTISARRMTISHSPVPLFAAVLRQRTASLGSMRRREIQLCEGFLADVGPPAGDDLRLGVEPHSLGTVNMVVAEQRVLPSPEGVEGHGHRNRHVDADHPDAHFALERARHLARGGEHSGAVAVRVGVDQLDRGVQRRYPHHAQH